MKKNLLNQIGLILGPLGGLFAYLLLSDFDHAFRMTAATAVLMVLWWLTEALPVYVTALLPLFLFPLFGSVSLQTAGSSYLHPIIFLFMGGFMMAKAMERWNLHKRMALTIIGFMGDKPIVIIAGFMLASFFLSMWISNTATVVMMLPIVVSVIHNLNISVEDQSGSGQNLSKCLLLGIAYAASIGGVSTLIGSPPNALFAAFMSQEYGQVISFSDWIKMGLPLALVFLPLCWLVLTQLIFPIKIKRIPGLKQMIGSELQQLGPVKPAEYSVLMIFFVICFLWLFHPLITKWLPTALASLINDSSIALFGAALMFVLPSWQQKKERLLNWENAKKIPWGILILFGGGLSLAAGLSQSGVAQFIGEKVVGLGTAHPLVLLFIVVSLVIFLTEIMSNTATIAMFLPILASIAASSGLSPLVLLLPATLAASFAFMMPVATPPNAIVFSSGKISIAEMARAGLVLNICGILLISFYSWWLI